METNRASPRVRIMTERVKRTNLDGSIARAVEQTSFGAE